MVAQLCALLEAGLLHMSMASEFGEIQRKAACENACGVRPVDDQGSFVPLSALSAHQNAHSELAAFNLMPDNKKQITSSYLSISGSRLSSKKKFIYHGTIVALYSPLSFRYHLHQELVQDEARCWLCSDCTAANS